MTKQKHSQQRHPMKTHRTHEQRGVLHHDVEVHDPYAGPRHATGRFLVRAYTNFLDWYLRGRLDMPFDHRKNLARKLSYMPKGMQAWAAYMPGGLATFYATEPQHSRMENGVKLDIITRNFFKHTYDAVGLRSRTAVLAALVAEHSTNEWHEKMKWVSIAAGAGQHVHATLESLPEGVRRTIDWTCVDIDSAIIEFAKSQYSAHNFQLAGAVFAVDDIFDPAVQARLRVMQPDIIDAMGLCDYLTDAQLVTLCKAVYDMMPKNGIFVFSNMNADRPHLHVHQRAVGWPGVIPRTVDDITRVLSMAGVSPEHMMTYRPQDGVYTVYKVVKV